MPYLPSILRPFFEQAETALLRNGTEPRSIQFLAFSVDAGPFWQRWLQGRASRFVAYCRRIRWLARHPEQRFSIAKGVS
jgi:hypothetical protein